MTSTMSEEICQVLRDCDAFDYAHYFSGLQTKEDLYRFSLKDLAQTLPFGREGLFIAYNIQNHLFHLQRQELDTWIDPRVGKPQFNFTPPQFSLGQSSSSSRQRSSTSKRNEMNQNNGSSGASSSRDGRSRSHDSKYKSSPHIVCTTDKFNHKLYLCKYCDKTFRVPNQAVIHSRKHTGEKPYSCTVCEKKFSQVSSRNLHIKREHGGKEKAYECQYCGKKFNEVAQRATHLLTHTGEKPFPCKFCPKAYTQISSRNLHVRNHHPEYS